MTDPSPSTSTSDSKKQTQPTKHPQGHKTNKSRSAKPARTPSQSSKRKPSREERSGKDRDKVDEEDGVKEYEVDGKKLDKYLDKGTGRHSNARALISKGADDWKKLTHKNKKLAGHLAGLSKGHKTVLTQAVEHDDLLLPDSANGRLLEPENVLEKTYKVRQTDIVQAGGRALGAKCFALALDGGPFSFDYTRNGRQLVLGARRSGALATVDWPRARPLAEVCVGETTRAVRWLHNEALFAAAQRRYVYIYDGRSGAEVHQLRGHVEVTQMEFLPYHFLLATIGLPGWLRYHDTSTGALVAQHRTAQGPCHTMAQNTHNSVIHLGHQNGTVSLWSPATSQPLVKLLAHLGPVSAIAIDPSSAGRTMASTGLDGTLKVWDMRTWKALASWTLKKPATCAAWSQRGLLAVGWGAHVSLYAGVGRNEAQRGAYMSQLFPGEEVSQVQFCPYEDLLGVGHSAGFAHLAIPGAGEANYDSLEADPFENGARRREREVRSLLDKLPPDLIALDTELAGGLAPQGPKESEELKTLKRKTTKPTPYRKLDRLEKLELRGQLGLEDDENDDEADQAGTTTAKEAGKEKKKMRGKNSSLKRLMRKKRKNVITPETEALKAKNALRKQQHQQRSLKSNQTKSLLQKPIDALSRFS